MLNESKVKLMTRMAMYESKQGEEDFKISSYYKKDYRSFHTIATIIWVTVGYAVAVGIGVIAFLDELMGNFFPINFRPINTGIEFSSTLISVYGTAIPINV